MIIKICGITSQADALYAEKLGATHLGFIFYKKSPRYISPQKALTITQALNPKTTTVGVFVNENSENLSQIAKQSGIQSVQLHGDESTEYCKKMSLPIIKAFRVASQKDLDTIPSYRGRVSAILLDTFVKGQLGGTGKSFNWDLAFIAKQFKIPLYLSGGLTPDTVQDAIQLVQPEGIDVSSGVESSPGIKDHQKLSRFLKNATTNTL